MNKTEHLLTCLIDECAEIQQAATKALRFGLDDLYGEKTTTPRQDIVMECIDLLAVVEMLKAEGIIGRTGVLPAMNRKKVRLLKYMQYAQEHGSLTL